VPTVLLIRHGRTSANASGVLAGWSPGIELDEAGARQAEALAARLAGVALAAMVTSPLDRCRQTALAVRAVAGPTGPRPPVVDDERLGECRYGTWTGRLLKELSKDPLWRVVQAHPSAVTFPGADGEAMLAMQHRAVAAVREHDARVAGEAGEGAVWAAFSHADVIKAVLADALGMHLDAFQRIVVDPCSVSVVRYTALRPFAVRVNDVGGDLASVVPPASKGRRRGTRPKAGAAADLAASDAVVGGGAGASAAPGA
jgi:probable phosphomutase (TIGR03848 family)